MFVKVKKLFNGYASIRSPIIEKCLANGEPLNISYAGQLMTVKLSRDKLFSINPQSFKSRYDGSEYKLYDFKFVANPKSEQLVFDFKKGA